MSKRNLLITLVLLTIGVIGLTVIFKRPTQTLRLSQPLGKNMRFADLVDSTNVRYFTGSIFVSLDTISGKTVALSQALTLPNVTEAKWGRSAVVFKANNYSSLDQLNTQLENLVISAYGTYWWYEDFKTKKVSIIGSSTPTGFIAASDVSWSEDGSTLLFVRDSETKSSQNVIQQFQDGSQKILTSLQGTNKLIAASTTNVMYINKSNDSSLKILNISAKKTNTLATANGVEAYASSDASSAVYITASKDAGEGSAFVNGDLLLAQPDAKVKRIDKKITGTAIWDTKSNWIFLSGNATKLSGYSQDQAGVIKKVAINNGKSKIDFSAAQVRGYQNGVALILNSDNTAYLASKTEPHIATRSIDITTLKNPIYTSDFYMTYDTSKEQFTIYIIKNPYQVGVSKSIEYIKNRGIDPYQLNIKWYPYDGVTAN